MDIYTEREYTTVPGTGKKTPGEPGHTRDTRGRGKVKTLKRSVGTLPAPPLPPVFWFKNKGFGSPAPPLVFESKHRRESGHTHETDTPITNLTIHEPWNQLKKQPLPVPYR